MRHCYNCGKELGELDITCTACGRTNFVRQPEKYKLKWYKYLIYFDTFASAATATVEALIFILLGVFLKGYYVIGLDTLKPMGFMEKSVLVTYGVVLLANAVLFLVSRHGLAQRKTWGPKAIYGALGLRCLSLPVAVFFLILSKSIFALILMLTILHPFGMLASIIKWDLNYIYFKKRKGFFDQD